MQRRLLTLRRLASAKYPNLPFDNRHIGFKVQLCRQPMAVDVFELAEPRTATVPESLPLDSTKQPDESLTTLRISLDDRFKISDFDTLVEVPGMCGGKASRGSSDTKVGSDRGHSEITPELIDRLSQYIVRSWRQSGGIFKTPWSFSSVDAAIQKLYRESDFGASVNRAP